MMACSNQLHKNSGEQLARSFNIYAAKPNLPNNLVCNIQDNEQTHNIISQHISSMKGSIIIASSLWNDAKNAVIFSLFLIKHPANGFQAIFLAGFLSARCCWSLLRFLFRSGSFMSGTKSASFLKSVCIIWLTMTRLQDYQTALCIISAYAKLWSVARETERAWLCCASILISLKISTIHSAIFLATNC